MFCRSAEEVMFNVFLCVNPLVGWGGGGGGGGGFARARRLCVAGIVPGL